MKLTWDETTYLTNKCHRLNYDKYSPQGITFPWDNTQLNTFLSGVGLTPRTHYNLYGIEEKINPFIELDDFDTILTQETWNILDTVNTYWNNALTWVSDLNHYGFNEFWTIPIDGLGDCEDHGLAKQKYLWDQYKINSWMVVCGVNTPGDHAVLCVHTNLGDYILDNRYSTVKNVNELNYTWSKIECKNLKWKYITGIEDSFMGSTYQKKLILGNECTPYSGWTYWRNRLPVT